MNLCARFLIRLSGASYTLLLLSPFTRFPSAQAQNKPSYEITAVKNEMVRMRDGVKLATDIYRPAQNGSAVEGKFPVILERTPYNKDSLYVAASHYVRTAI